MDMDIEGQELLIKRSWLAARRAVTRLGVDVSQQDLEDVEQAARIGFWRAWQKKPGNVGYAFISARNEATIFIIRTLFGSNPMGCTDIEKVQHFLAAQHAGQRGPLPDEVKRELFEIFLGSRKKKGTRGMLASMRDTFICNALAQEKNNEGIGMELGIPPEHVKQYRLRIRKVLLQKGKIDEDEKGNLCTVREAI